MKPRLPFRLGSTSYVYPAEILPNVRRLAPVVDDVELVLFEVDNANNLPSPGEIAEMAAIASDHGLSYTVHLPLDLRLATDDAACRDRSIDTARRVVAATQPLRPWAYVLHLDGEALCGGASRQALDAWRDQAARSLELIAGDTGDMSRFAVENLQSYPPDAFLPLIADPGVSLCLDVGHLVKVGADPVRFAQLHVARTRVVHLHGAVDGRDHKSLVCLPPRLLERLLKVFLSARYGSVLTIEVFSEDDFFSSRAVIMSTLEELEWRESLS